MANGSIPQTGSQQEREAAQQQARQEKQQEQKQQRELRGPLQTERGITTLEDTVVAKVAGMAAREVVVAALGTVYALSGNEDVVAEQLGSLIAAQWPLSTALSLLVWFVYAPQCIATLATVRRETGSWREVGIMAVYLFGLAYLASFITFRVTEALL